MSTAQTLTENSAIGVLDVTCPICGIDLDIPVQVDFLRYPTNTNHATGILADHHTCHPKENQ